MQQTHLMQLIAKHSCITSTKCALQSQYFTHNCFSRPSQLFVIGGVEITSSKGNTQSDPVVMAAYAITIIPLILMILEITESYPEGTSKAAVYANDLTVAGCIPGLKYWLDQLCE